MLKLFSIGILWATLHNPVLALEYDFLNNPRNASQRAWPNNKSDPFQAKIDSASSFKISKDQVESGYIINDNDEALAAKLKVIRNAQSGDHLDLMYYIFSDDESSSYFAKALIEAAQRGAKVRLLVDYIANYSHLDFFNNLEYQSQGNLEVRFYNKPTTAIIEDSAYLTLRCSDPDKKSCEKEKEEKIKNGENGLNGMFLSGLYAKNFLLAGITVYLGQDLSRVFSGSDQISESDKNELKRALRIIYDAKIGGKFLAKLALVMHGKQIEPLVNTFQGILPSKRIKNSRQDWEFITDFMHMKLVSRTTPSGQTELVLGGRNIENSYHMQMIPKSEHPFHQPDEKLKYTFMDTDFYVNYKDSQRSLNKRFNQIWNFDTMISTLAEVDQITPYKYILAHQAVGEICKEQSGETYIKCYSEHFTKELLNVQSLQTRMKSQNETIVAKSREFQAKYSPRPEPDQPNIILDTSSPDSWELHYLENLPFDSHGNRMFGANVSHLEKSGKFLHQVWGEALNDMCKSKVRTNRQVYIHNAYVFLPGNLFGTILDMTTSGGALDCENVTIKVITNSFYSTDLNPINLLNDIMVAKLFTQYKQDRNHQKVASLNYYEYLPHNIEEAIESRKQGLSGHSLHSKVNVFGDDVMIGSANADPRSMMMDANNGIYIRNAPHLAYHYSHWLDEKIGDSNQIVDLTESYLNKTVAEVEQESHERLDQLVAQYEHIEFIGKYKPRIREFYSALIKFSTSCGKSTIFDLETMSDPFGSFNPDPKIRPNDCSFNKFNLRLKAF